MHKCFVFLQGTNQATSRWQVPLQRVFWELPRQPQPWQLHKATQQWPRASQALSVVPQQQWAILVFQLPTRRQLRLTVPPGGRAVETMKRMQMLVGRICRTHRSKCHVTIRQILVGYVGLWCEHSVYYACSCVLCPRQQCLLCWNGTVRLVLCVWIFTGHCNECKIRRHV